MRAELGNLNHYAVPFLSRVAVNLFIVQYTMYVIMWLKIAWSRWCDYIA